MPRGMQRWNSNFNFSERNIARCSGRVKFVLGVDLQSRKKQGWMGF
jgi:hypothetical protein